MSLRSWTLAAFGTFALAGCTSLQTLPDNFRSRSRDMALEGYPYALPMRQFDLTASWTLTECSNGPKTGDEAPKTVISPELEVTPLITAGERYLVDYRALASVLKTTDLAIETYPEGTLKAVNAVADDRTAETAVAIAKIVASAATFGASGGTIKYAAFSDKLFSEIKGAVPEHFIVSCSDSAIAQLAKVATEEAALKASNLRIKDASILVEQLALAGMVDAKKRAELATALENLRKASGEVEGQRKKLATAREPLQIVRKLRWPEDFADGGQDPFAIEGNVTDLFGNLFVLKGADAEADDCLEGFSVDNASQLVSADVNARAALTKCLSGKLQMHARLDSAFSLANECPDSESASGARFACRVTRPEGPPTKPGQDYTAAEWQAYQEAKAVWKATAETPARDRLPDKGLFVRPPEQARLVACKTSALCDPDNPADPENPKETMLVKATDWMTSPQLGQLRFLPFENRMFENNALVLQLAKDGTVEKFQYATKSAIAERMASAAASIADAATSGRKAWREEKAARRTEQIAELDHQIAVYEKEKAVDALGAPVADAEEEAEQAQKIALKIELEVEDRLIEAQSDGGG